MSNVPVSKRKPSPVQFIDTARQLAVHTLQYIKKFPKSTMFLLNKDIADQARLVYTEVIKANSVLPSAPHGLEFRREHFYNALAALNALDALISIATGLIPAGQISEYGWTHWGELILQERKLLKGIISSDNATSLK